MQPQQIAAAKMVIATVARSYFGAEKTVEEFASMLHAENELQDIDQFQNIYAGDKGLFLVVLDGERLVGTGALRPASATMAELKRLWLLEEYHGRGIGYRLVMHLFDFARKAGYRRVCLQTSIEQKRAITFYKRIGFVEVPAYNEQPYDDDISLQIDLD